MIYYVVLYSSALNLSPSVSPSVTNLGIELLSQLKNNIIYPSYIETEFINQNIIIEKIAKMVKNCQNDQKMSIHTTSLPIESIIRSIYIIYHNIS